jgi:hypothetical protein
MKTLKSTNNHFITLAEASAMTQNYRNNLSDSAATIAHAIGKSSILDILSQDNCIGLRIYYALNNDGEKQLVFVGVDAAGNDLYEGLIADRTLLCPNLCSVNNPLNSGI